MTDAVINNQFYDELHERWYTDDTHIIALLRAESKKKLVYVEEVFAKAKIRSGAKILDVGCGAGLIANPLAASTSSYDVCGIDQSESSLNEARRRALPSARVRFEKADAYALPYENASFDAVLLLDFLEHVDDPDRAIGEALRVLAPGGVLIFYTFNRTWIAGLLAVKAVEIIARDCPKNFHLLKLFIKPAELQSMVEKRGAQVREFRGLRPKIFTNSFWLSLFSRRVHKDFDFAFTRDLKLAYMGYATWK